MFKSQRKDKELVLSYQDCVLRQADLNLLHGPFWLNDAIIGFYFEYLEQKYKIAHSKLLFVSPVLTQLLKLTDADEYSIFLDPLQAKQKEFIFFPVNDCTSRDSPGGSHWNLIVISNMGKTCFFLDSSRGLCFSPIRDFSKNIMTYLLGKDLGRFIEVDCPQQENEYDCGLFVLCFADTIAEYVLKAYNIEACNYSNIQKLVSEKREFLLFLIDTLKKSKK